MPDGVENVPTTEPSHPVADRAASTAPADWYERILNPLRNFCIQQNLCKATVIVRQNYYTINIPQNIPKILIGDDTGGVSVGGRSN